MVKWFLFIYKIGICVLKNRLLINFCNEEDVQKLSQEIAKYYFGFDTFKIFILEADQEFVISYSAPSFEGTFLPGTIVAHRKKHTSTIYTINALNALIKELNDGQLDPKFIVNWEMYRNTILLVEDNKLRKIETKLYKIISNT